MIRLPVGSSTGAFRQGAHGIQSRHRPGRLDARVRSVDCPDLGDSVLGGLPTSTVLNYVVISSAECATGTMIEGDFVVPELADPSVFHRRELQQRIGSQ